MADHLDVQSSLPEVGCPDHSFTAAASCSAAAGTDRDRSADAWDGSPVSAGDKSRNMKTSGFNSDSSARAPAIRFEGRTREMRAHTHLVPTGRSHLEEASNRA